MKVIFINLLLIFIRINGFAQTNKVAILDFENTSGKTEYEALGKAMSSMLITDLSNNIHPKKFEFFERSQLNKLSRFITLKARELNKVLIIKI